MASAHQQPNFPPQPHLIIPNQKPQIIPVKAGFMGEQGTGKTSSAALFAVALSKLHHAGAPVHVTDPELGWQYLDPVIFEREGVKLVQYTVPTFAAMLQDIKRAEREGACVWAVELGKIWIEIIRTLQKQKPNTWGMELRAMWDDFVAQFLNSKLHCLVLGRIQDVIEQVVNEDGKVQDVKVGEGMKAGGAKNNFGYEPNLVIRMSLEHKPRTRKGKLFVDEGRVIHRAVIAKDRTWALNGQVFRWADRDGYRRGDFKYVWESLAPHFAAAQRTRKFITLDAAATSASIIEPEGSNSEWYAERNRRDVLIAEISASLDMNFGGRKSDEVHVRLAASDLIFGVKSKEAAAALSIDKLERGLAILHAFERIPEKNRGSREAVLLQVHDAIVAYDTAGEPISDDDIPF
jgi:hypothetical protein